VTSSIRIVLVASALLLGGLPLWGGCAAQRAFLETAETLERGLHGSFEVETAFQRGWLGSRAETRLSGAVGGASIELVLRHRVVHGPLPLGELLEGRLPRRPVRAIVYTRIAHDPAEGENQVPALEARTRIDLDGSLRVTLESPPFASERLQWAGLHGTLASPDSSLALATGIIEAPRLEVTSGESRLRVQDIAVELETRARIQELPLGSLSVSVGLVERTSPAGTVVLRDLQWEQRGEEDLVDATWGLAFSASLDHLEFEGERYGPGAVELALRSLDPGAVRSLREAAAATRAGPDPPASPDLADVERLLARSPELELALLELVGRDGMLRATGRLRVDGEHPDLRLGPHFALAALEGRAELAIPIRWLQGLLDAAAAAQLREVPEASVRESLAVARRGAWLDSLLHGGWIVRTGDVYRVRVDYRDRELRVNGVPLERLPSLQLPDPRSVPRVAAR
jgi:uncharacterized protein YdgA (DUF945 family)